MVVQHTQMSTAVQFMSGSNPWDRRTSSEMDTSDVVHRRLLITRWWSSALISALCCGFLFQTRLVNDMLCYCDILIPYVISTLFWHLVKIVRILYIFTEDTILQETQNKASLSSIDAQIDIFVLLKCHVKNIFFVIHDWMTPKRLFICQCSFGIYSSLCSSARICDKQI